MLSRAKQRKLMKSPGATYVGFSVLFDLAREPALQYTLGQVSDIGVDVSFWTSYRLKSSVIVVETETERFEISRDGVDPTGYDTYRFARVRDPASVGIDAVRLLGVPLPETQLDVLASHLDWSCFRWRDDGLRVSPPPTSPEPEAKTSRGRRPSSSAPPPPFPVSLGSILPPPGVLSRVGSDTASREMFRPAAPDCGWGFIGTPPVADLSQWPVHAQIFLPPGGPTHSLALPHSAKWPEFLTPKQQEPSPPKRGKGKRNAAVTATPQVSLPAWLHPCASRVPTGSVPALCPDAENGATPVTSEGGGDPEGDSGYVKECFDNTPPLPAEAVKGLTDASNAAVLLQEAAEASRRRAVAAAAALAPSSGPSSGRSNRASSSKAAAADKEDEELFSKALLADPRLHRRPLLEPDGSVFLPLRTVRFLPIMPPQPPLPASQAAQAAEAMKNELDSALAAYKQRRGTLPTELAGVPVPNSLQR
jgi:hypothetical protein